MRGEICPEVFDPGYGTISRRSALAFARVARKFCEFPRFIGLRLAIWGAFGAPSRFVFRTLLRKVRRFGCCIVHLVLTLNNARAQNRG